ncbi:MAG: 16S rRNA (cytosine(1402)-N(4))-methyltransferase RsmH [Bacillota bacterium]
MNNEHQPVLLKETISYLKCKEDGIYIDGTLGRGGHTKEILKHLSKKGQLIALDRDLEAVKTVKNKMKNKNNLKIVHDNFTNIPKILRSLNIKKVNGMLFDLGISSPQVDNSKRGFSYKKDGPLDMRMNRKQKLTAANIVNEFSQSKLSRIIGKYGEENWAARIAEFIIKERKKKTIKTTGQLVEIIKNAIPAGARRKGGHPAKRTFQALRIATNNELEQLEEMIEKVIPFLTKGGRICIISFHSLEDRIVKHSFRYLAKDCICPPDLPVCRCNKKSKVKVITKKPVRPAKEEIEKNPRARSAKLRVAERVLN